jgi:hypothetical protein
LYAVFIKKIIANPNVSKPQRECINEHRAAERLWLRVKYVDDRVSAAGEYRSGSGGYY